VYTGPLPEPARKPKPEPAPDLFGVDRGRGGNVLSIPKDGSR
jgi:hypothetical protein